MTNKTNHFFWMDWIRFLAAFMVLLVHARHSTWLDYGELNVQSKGLLTQTFFLVTRMGKEAVMVFFVMSGYLVGGGVIEKLFTNSFDLKKYIIDRVTRIYVPLVPVMIMTGLLSSLILKSDHSIFVGIGNLIGLQGVFFEPYAGNGPLWSLAYEIWFYILAGSLASVAIFKNNKMGFFICLALLISSLCIFTKLDCTYLYIWGFGAIAFFYRDFIRQNGSSLVGVFCILTGVVACQLTSASKSIFFENLSYLLPSKSVAEIMLGVGISIILPFITNASPQNNILVRIEKLGTSLAAFSYTLYLTHYPFLWATNKFWPRVSNVDESSILRFLMVIFLSILVAWLFYFPFESQTSKVRKWLLIKFS